MPSAAVHPTPVESPEQRWERRLHWPVVAAALLAIPGVFLGVSRLPEPWPTVATVLHWTVWLVFASEVLVMLAVTSDRGRWVRSHKLGLFVVLVSSPLLPALALLARSLQGAQTLKLLKVVKLAKLAKGAKTAKAGKLVLARPLLRLGRLWRVVRTLSLRLRLRQLTLSALVGVTVLMVLGSLTLLVEGEEYRSPAHGVWHVLEAVAAELRTASSFAWGSLVAAGALLLVVLIRDRVAR